MSILPKSIDYRELPNSLSNDIKSNIQILNPGNSKSTYTANDIINFDFNSDIVASLILRAYILVIR